MNDIKVRYCVRKFADSYSVFDNEKNQYIEDLGSREKCQDRCDALNNAWNDEYKVVISYDGILLKFKDVEDVAKNLFALTIKKSEDGRRWDVFVNGTDVAHYVTSEEDARNGWTYDEVLKDYMKSFVQKNTFKNLKWYKIMS